MPRRDRRGHGGPPADPFGADDPAWELYEPNVNRLRRWKPSISRWREKRPGELQSFMLIGSLAVLLVAGAIALLLWLVAILGD